MKIGIISDIHDNSVNLRLWLDRARDKGLEAAVCCGDVARLETLVKLSRGFSGNIYLVRGNACFYETAEANGLPNVRGGEKLGRWEIDGRFIGACHEPFLVDQVLESGNCDYVFYGHTHKPWIETRGKTVIANPGTLGGIVYPACFAVLDTETGELVLKRLEEVK